MTAPSFVTSLVIVHLLAAALTAGLGVYVYRTSRRKPIGKVFTATVAAFTVWTVFSMLRVFTTDPTAYVALTTLKYLGVTTAPVFFFLFGLVYADGEHYVTPRTVGALLVFPALTVLVLASTLEHGLFYAGFETRTVAGMAILETVRGPWFWAFAVYGWGFLALGSFLLVYGGYRLPALYRTHAAFVVVGMLLPWGVSVGYIGYGWPHPAVDPTPLGFAAASALWAVGIFSTDLVDVSPVARSRVVSTIDNPVVVVDTNGRVTDVNEAARPLLETAEPYGDPAAEALPAALAERAAGETSDDGDGDGDGDGDPLELSVEGETRYFQSRVLPLGPEGRYGSVLILTDVTELTSVRRQLEERNRALERQNDRLDEFTSLVSHDLRNPLTVAQGNLEFLREETDSEFLDEIERSHERMRTLIDELLELARHGRAVGDTEAVSLESVARSAWVNVDSRGATLTVEADPGTVEADPSRLTAVFENLFRNAVEHGGEDVTVRVGTLEDGFYVEDDGPGVPAEERERVFDHGYTTSDAGTGFGLNIVRNVVEAHGWEIRLTDSDEGGARFEVVTQRDGTTPAAVAAVGPER